MTNKVTALALTLILCAGQQSLPVALAAKAPPAQPIVPTIKSGIAQNTTAVELTLGKAQIIHLNVPASRVSISDPEVVGMVLISPTEVELIGKSIGVANLLVWSEQTGQNYLSIDLSVNRDVSSLARKIQMIDPGINILPVAAEDSVILTGVAESQEKAQLAYDLTKAFFSSDDKGAPGAGGGESTSSSNSPGSATFAETSTKIINLIRVMGQPSTKAEMVQERLRDIDKNITLKVVPGFGGKEKAILTGRVRNASMVAKAINLTSVFYGTPGLVVLAGQGGNVVEGDQQQQADGGDGGFQAGAGGGLLSNFSKNVLHGSIITDKSGNVVSMLEVEERPQIRCSVRIMEVQKARATDFTSSLRIFDDTVRFTSYAGRQGVATVGQQQVLLNDINTFFNQINGNSFAELGIRYGDDFASLVTALVSTQRARVLAEPTLTSISGEPASFLAGGEFPIPVIGTNGGVSILFKEFGIRLNLLATVTERGTIHMQVSPEVSTLDPAAGIDVQGLRVNGLRTRRSQGVVEMRNGEHFVLSGLYNQDMTDIINKTPLLGQIPILGALFSSRQYQKRDTELVIVIQPQVVDSMNLSNVEQANMQQASAPTQQKPPISPEELLAQYRALQGKSGKLSEEDKALVNGSDKTPKSAKAATKAMKKANREAEKKAKALTAGQPENSLKGEDLTAKATDQPSTPTPTVATPSADYLKTQQQTLLDVLKNLDTSASPPTQPTSQAPDDGLAPVAPVTATGQPIKQVAFLPPVPPVSPIVPAVEPAATAQEPAKKPVSVKTKAVRAARHPAKTNATASAMLQQNLKLWQKHLGQFFAQGRT